MHGIVCAYGLAIRISTIINSTRLLSRRSVNHLREGRVCCDASSVPLPSSLGGSSLYAPPRPPLCLPPFPGP